MRGTYLTRLSLTLWMVTGAASSLTGCGSDLVEVDEQGRSGGSSSSPKGTVSESGGATTSSAGGTVSNAGSTTSNTGGAASNTGGTTTQLAPPCSTFGSSTVTGTLFDGATGISGIVASRKQPGVFWIHSDRQKNLFAIDKTGKLLGQWELVTDSKYFWVYNWEDISIQSNASGPDRIWIGDIGNNYVRSEGEGEPRTSLLLMTIDEPTVDYQQVITGTAPVTGSFEMTYPDALHDAEGMALDPLTGDVYVFAKEEAAPSKIFRAKAPIASGVLEYVASIDSYNLNAADFSPSGRELVVRNYSSMFYWALPDGKAWQEALGSPPNNEGRLKWTENYYSEAIGFSADETGVYAVSEEAEGAASPSPVEFYSKNCN